MTILGENVKGENVTTRYDVSIIANNYVKQSLNRLKRQDKRIASNHRGTQRQFSENICSADNLRSRIFGTFVVKFLACLPLLGFSNI